MSYLSLDQIAKATDVPVVDLEMPEWGGVIKVKGMNAAERLELAALVGGDADKRGAIATIARFALLHGVVEPAISEDDIDMLLSKSSKAIERIVENFNKLSGTSEEAVLEARGNS